MEDTHGLDVSGIIADNRAAEKKRKNKAVAIWLLTGVFMIIVQVLLGGVTRLTGSGLSITKWNPIFGILPPLSDRQWNDAFDGYKQIGQFKYLNSDFSLSDFKFIFFWEWFHRFWARMLGIVFSIGFIFFLVRGYFNKKMIMPLVYLFILGGLQGAIGWIMVASGLNDEHLYVDHIRLAFHFIAAMLLACYTLWFALQLLIPEEKRTRDGKLLRFTIIILALLFVQLTYGAFMAGLKAAMAAATWPTINGMWVPDNLMQQSFINNPINIHFVHRTLAYTLFFALAAWCWWAIKLYRTGTAPLLKKAAVWTITLVTAQVLLGILTVISAPHIVHGTFGRFEILAELHQLVAMFLLMSLVVNIYLLDKSRYKTAR